MVMKYNYNFNFTGVVCKDQLFPVSNPDVIQFHQFVSYPVNRWSPEVRNVIFLAYLVNMVVYVQGSFCEYS